MGSPLPSTVAEEAMIGRVYALLFLACMALVAMTVPYGVVADAANWTVPGFFFLLGLIFWGLWVREGKE